MLVHPDRQHLIYPLGSVVVIEDLATNKQDPLLSDYQKNVSCVAVSKSGKYIASGEETHMGFHAGVLLWDYEKRKLIKRFELHKVKVEALAFSPNDLYLISLGGQDDARCESLVAPLVTALHVQYLPLCTIHYLAVIT